MPSEKETVEIDDIFNADDMDVEDHLDYSSDPMEEDESFEELFPIKPVVLLKKMKANLTYTIKVTLVNILSP
ncbi:unnamed protein product [Umbelopsis sp. WA50703]